MKETNLVPYHGTKISKEVVVLGSFTFKSSTTSPPHPNLLGLHISLRNTRKKQFFNLVIRNEFYLFHSHMIILLGIQSRLSNRQNLLKLTIISSLFFVKYNCLTGIVASSCHGSCCLAVDSSLPSSQHSEVANSGNKTIL